MNTSTTLTLAGLLLATASHPAAAAGVHSDFSLDSEGWTVTTFNDNGQPNFLDVRTSALAPSFVATGGDPGGFIQTTDPDEGWTYFVAPTKFLGDQGAHLGGSIEFSLQQALNGGTLISAPPQAVLTSGSQVLVADAGAPPANTPDWSRYSVRLTAGHWHLGTLNGALATDAQFALTLGALDGLFLVAEFVTPVVEVTGLDRVTLAAVPLPAAAFSMLSALGVLCLCRRSA